MKHIFKFFTTIWTFFYQFTPKGKQEEYWKQAETNLETHFLEKGIKELEVKKKCVDYATKVSKKKRLSNFHLAKITTKKHKEDLIDTGVKIDSQTLKFTDA